MAGTRVEPYWELTFDADGDVHTGERDGLVTGAGRERLTDLVIFAHGWNNDRPRATGLYRRFFAPFPALVDGAVGADGAEVRMGYGGVIWPSMRFADEPVPDFPEQALATTVTEPPVLDAATRQALTTAFPGSEETVARLAELLERRPEAPEPLAEFTGLVRALVTAGHTEQGGAGLVQDLEGESEPTVLAGDPEVVCAAFADALAGGETPAELFGGGWKKLWKGAHELLRQASYYTMKRRAGTVGERGLGPALGVLARSAPDLRVHLVGHSFGARLMAFGLRGLPEEAAVSSLTLLQGAFSHYAFSSRLPFDSRRGGALKGAYRRVRGPVVCVHSRHDTALGVMYPLASRLARDADSVLGIDNTRWGAMGYDGIQAVDGSARVSLARALDGGLPDEGCASVDASAVVSRGGPPSGAHSDICHDELARLILLAGRIGG
ncbi:alpha/beta fold hydrolase [Streptomyces syringium]|uniref:alpha/beta fold hydrolase n=1 Tax=Streptomyces syringium TaxID=76729 RepID=UPI0036A3F247